jgi:hypothetical protein
MSAAAIALVFDPDVLHHYRYALMHPPSGNVTPTAGAMLRLLFGEEKTWLQYLPTLGGIVWLGFYWWRHRQGWDWAEQTPILIMVSFLTTAYGAWIFDVVVLLLPVLQVAVWAVGNVRLGRLALACFLAINGAALVMNLAEVSYPAFIWVTPAILVSYFVLRRQEGGLVHA